MKKTELSASSQKIIGLIATVTGGSQRKFARLVGCSQPVISRIVNGLQEPGRELLERIAKLDCVDRADLLATLKSEAAMSRLSETMISIAICLLDGPPVARRDLLTRNTVVVSPGIFRQSLYAVAARACEPAFADPLERMQPDDLIVIDSSMEGLRKNLTSLNGRLFVVMDRSPNGNAITLQRVFVTFDSEVPRLTIRIKVQEPVEESSRKSRAIILDDDSKPVPKPPFAERVLEFDDIAGVAIELVRNL